MKKMIIWGALCLLPMQMSAQINPKEGYIITNEGDTIRGTINYLKDEAKLEARRGLVQQVGSLMSKDPTVAGRLWKMDLTSNALQKMVKRYDERYCTSEGDCVVLKKKVSLIFFYLLFEKSVEFTTFAGDNSLI